MKKIKSSGIVFVLITAICFGTMEIALKIAGNDFSALQLTFLRFFIGGLVLLPFAIVDLKKRKYKPCLSDFIYLLLLGAICICVSMTLFQVGVMMSNANTAAVIIAGNPVFTMVFAHFLVDDKFTKRKAVVLVVSLVGLVFVANPLNMVEGNSVKGILTVFVAAIAFGFYTAMGKMRVAKIGGLAENSFSFLLGSAVQFILLLITKTPVFSGITKSNIFLVLYLGFVVTGLGYFAYLKAIEISGPSNASIAFFIKPVIAVILAAIILKEAITVNIVVGVIIVLIGCVINNTGNKKKNN